MGVIGAGAWGTAMAQTLAVAGRQVTLWAFEQEVVDSINEARENKLYLPGAKLHQNIRATRDISQLASLDAVLVVTPAQHMRATLIDFVPHARGGMPVVLCSKGIEISSRKFMSQVLEEIMPSAMPAVLSGPSFAVDVVKGLPTAVTLACADWTVGAKLIKSVAAPTFRPYYTKDVLGAEIGGAVKNVLAIVCGLVLGKGLGRSAHAAIIARGFAEMTRLGTALGCNPETLTGLCGLGDLVLTCSSEQSRNMSFGMALGQGISYDEYMKDKNVVVEGAATAPALKALSQSKGVEMPICHAMANILAGDEEVDGVIMRLLARVHKSEIS
ncbi:MAG: NAD(P)-dependent glycerol-3-phosphate dehydrogenase [Hellea sp.]|nr:NAD(P)-dependent glycerol-3-phosphate dehydrogenase [Hellea sp.]